MMRAVLSLLVSLILSSGNVYAESCPSLPGLDATQVVAQWGTHRLTVADIDETIADELCRARLEYRRSIDALRRAALKNVIDERLLTEERKTQKLKSLQELIQKMVIGKVSPPSEAAIKMFYEQNKGRMQGATFEQVKEQIREYLLESARIDARDRYLDGLREAFKVQTTLPPFRVPVSTDGPARGKADAPIVIVSFSDYECPYCASGAQTLKMLQERYPKKVRVVFKDFPLDFHPGAVPAAVAARCAGKQEKYWAMHDLLFSRPGFTVEDLSSFATELGLDAALHNKCVQDPAVAEAVFADRKLGQSVGVDGTPAFFVNGILLTGAQPLESFVELIEQELGQPPAK